MPDRAYRRLRICDISALQLAELCGSSCYRRRNLVSGGIACFYGDNQASVPRVWPPGFPKTFGPWYMRAHTVWQNGNQILRGEQTRCEENYYTVDHECRRVICLRQPIFVFTLKSVSVDHQNELQWIPNVSTSPRREASRKQQRVQLLLHEYFENQSVSGEDLDKNQLRCFGPQCISTDYCDIICGTSQRTVLRMNYVSLPKHFRDNAASEYVIMG